MGILAESSNNTRRLGKNHTREEKSLLVKQKIIHPVKRKGYLILLKRSRDFWVTPGAKDTESIDALY
jgi:hypothetical protein